MEQQKITIHNLAVVDIPHADRVPDKDLSWKNGSFFAAEECDRQLLIGSVDELQHIPDAIKQIAVTPDKARDSGSIIIATGADAYRHLLKVATGLLDKQLGEKVTIEHIRSRWQTFTRAEGESHAPVLQRKARFMNIIEAMFADSKAVRAKVFEDRAGGNYLRPVSAEPAVAARNMLDIKPVDTILVIGEKEGITLNTLKILDTIFKRQKDKGITRGGVIFTHPDNEECEYFDRKVAQLSHDKEIKEKISSVPFDKAMAEVFPVADFVINCQPMDNGKADEALIQSARNRTNPNATLVHLKGVPQDRNKSSAAWQQAGIERVIFAESLQRQKELDITHNKRMSGFAESAIANCVASRLIGRNPVRDRLLMETGEYRQFISNAPRPRGPLDHADRTPDEKQLGM